MLQGKTKAERLYLPMFSNRRGFRDCVEAFGTVLLSAAGMLLEVHLLLFTLQSSSSLAQTPIEHPKISPAVHRAVVETLESRHLLSAGGGWTNAGLTGAYYNNTTLTGTASFTRKDVRIDFDWGTTVKPGGSIAPGFRDVGTDNYSIQWTGQVIPRFSETYTFKAVADDYFVLELRPAGASTWTTVINQTSVGTGTGTFAMTAGQAYDVRITYKEFTGAAEAKLSWSSPSTPEEVIDPAVQSGINLQGWTSAYTDIVKGARNSWFGIGGSAAPAMDTNGWPMGDCGYYFQESLNQGQDTDPLMRGTVTFSFDGKATLTVGGNADNNSLVQTYDAVNHRTTGSFTVKNRGANASNIAFSNATRPDGSPGFLNLKLMRPTAPDATTSYSSDSTFTPQFRDSLSPFTVIRHQYVANQQKEWSDRTTPTYFNQSGGTITSPYYGVGTASNNGASWEYKIMLSNEAGRDMMISLPPVASDSYIANLANLIRYGSDVNGTPYTSATANPAYPPLNPNLRVYFEIGNELWNWDGVFHTDWQNINQMVNADVVANNANFQQFNYDNQPTTKNPDGSYTSLNAWRFRKIIQRTIQESDIFRSVFGDSAMPNSGNTDARIRPLYEWQYANANDTAKLGLTWAERYYNNADGNHVATPHPVNYWIWGGGGATYYGANNGNGLTDLLANSSFDATTVANGYNQNPSGSGYTFTGTAGIARDAGSSDDIPTPRYGAQVGYITDTGAISFNFTVPSTQSSSTYGVSFKAVNRTKNGASSADTEKLRVYLDDTIDITAKTYSQANGYVPPGYLAGSNAWKARNVAWMLSDYYFTTSFNLTPGSTHKITIRGMGDASGANQPDQTALIDEIRITSVDAIFAGGIPGGGEATGQPVGQNIQKTMNTEADWAKAFGLQELSYESGWSLGGDDGGSWVQLMAKYGDPRTATAQKTFMNYFYQAGSAVNVFGTYAQWPSWNDFYAQQGLLDVLQYPIMQGIAQYANGLPAEATNGALVSAVLRPNTTSIQFSADQSGQITAAGGFLNWTVLAPRTGVYTLSLTTTGTGGTAAILADGLQIASGATGGSAITATVSLTKGNHSIRVLSTNTTAFTVAQLGIAGQNAPASPTLNTASDGDGSASLGWGAVSGATGYKVCYGSSSGVYANRIDVGNVTSYTLSGLTNNQQYFFTIVAYNANGESLPSNEKGVIPLAEGQVGRLVVFEFNGYSGSETSATGCSSSRTPASVLTRGSGWVPSNSPGTAALRANRFASGNASGVFGTSLADAISLKQYYQFSLSPVSGKTMSLQQLSWLAWFQSPSSAIGMGITYSTNGTSFSSGISATGSSSSSTTPWTVDLSGISALQNTASMVTFRIYMYGMAGFTCVALGDPSGNDVVLTGSFASTVTAPAAPSNLTATANSSTQITIGWTDNASDETGYTLQWASDAAFSQNLGSASVAANTTSYAVTGLSAATTYYFRVKASKTGAADSAYATAASATTLATTPAAPSNLTATAASSSQVNLSWTDNAGDETGYTLQWASDAAFSQNLGSASVAANTTSYAVTGLSAATTYYFRVKATKTGAADSAYAAAASATTLATTPAAPSNLTATAASSSQVNLSWTDNAGDETGYTIQRATDAAFSQNLISATVAANTTSYAVTGLSAATTYYFRVKASKTGAADSAYAAAASATTLPAVPAAPSNLTATASSSTQITIGWTDNASNETGFKIERKTGSSGTWTQIGTASANATSYVDTGLSAATQYYYRVRATNSAGDSAYSNEANATTRPAAPSTVSFQVNDGSAQRSMVTSLTLTFDRPVTLASGTVILLLRGGTTAFTTTLANPSGDGKTYVLSFSGTGITGSSLPDGVYDLSVNASLASDAYGQTLTGGNRTYSFLRLYGDYDGNGMVNNADYYWFKKSFNQTAGSAGYISCLDYDGNGMVNNSDYFYFKRNFNKTLTV